MKIFSFNIILLSALCLTLAGCSTNTLPYMKEETAKRLSSAAWMVERDLKVGSIYIRTYERMHERHSTANIYIEGEGGFGSFGYNPTPENPVALHLATKDSAENLAHIARPCQYTGMVDKNKSCTKEYWGGQEYSDKVIHLYHQALDDIIERYDIKGIHLIGHSGGATIAALLAEQRDDILSIRSVAGIMDTKTHALSQEKEVSGSNLNPVNIAHKIKDIPQFHFIGGKDQHVPPAVLHGYLQALPPTQCVHSLMVQEATHDKGWVDKWPELLKLPLSCYMKPEQIKKPEGTTDLPIFKPDFGKALKKKVKHKISTEKPVKP